MTSPPPRTYTIDILPVTSRQAADAFYHHLNIALSYFEVIEPNDITLICVNIAQQFHPSDTVHRCLSSTIEMWDHIYSEPEPEEPVT